MKKIIWVGVLLLVGNFSFAENLPDFTELVAKQVNTVVNISAVTEVPAHGGMRGNHPPIPEDDPMYQFFKRFGMPMPDSPNGGDEGDASPGGEEHSTGSGFILTNDGIIMTNAHVVEGSSDLTVTLQDKRQFKAKIIGVDSKTDVAVLKISASGLTPVKIGDSSQVKVGEWVVAIGSPFGFESSVTKGIVSAIGRSLPDETLVPFIQTDVPINPGNSGGPLFDMNGAVIGINSQIYSRTGGYMGLSFAIPIRVAMHVADQLRSDGKVSRGWMGVVIQEVTPELADSFGLTRPMGALVSSVEKTGPAAAAGIHPSDIILKFSGQSITNQEDLPRVVSETSPHSTVPVDVWRKGQMLHLTLQVGEMPTEKVSSRNNSPAAPKMGHDKAAEIGLLLGDLDEKRQNENDTKSGVIIRRAVGVAAQAGLQSGDIILSVNNSPVHSPKEFNLAISEFGSKPLALLIKRGQDTEFVSIKPKG